MMLFPSSIFLVFFSHTKQYFVVMTTLKRSQDDIFFGLFIITLLTEAFHWSRDENKIIWQISTEMLACESLVRLPSVREIPAFPVPFCHIPSSEQAGSSWGWRVCWSISSHASASPSRGRMKRRAPRSLCW